MPRGRVEDLIPVIWATERAGWTDFMLSALSLDFMLSALSLDFMLSELSLSLALALPLNPKAPLEEPLVEPRLALAPWPLASGSTD